MVVVQREKALGPLRYKMHKGVSRPRQNNLGRYFKATSLEMWIEILPEVRGALSCELQIKHRFNPLSRPALDRWRRPAPHCFRRRRDHSRGQLPSSVPTLQKTTPQTDTLQLN